jgi:transposase-like protein
MNVNLTDPKFHDENAAREWFEQSRWPNGVPCVHCGGLRVARMGGKAHRAGLFHCPDCRGQFTVRTGHVMESSKVPLTKWCLAFHLMSSSKKGYSAHQLHRTLRVAYNTAWFMEHRIREAMKDDGSPLGGDGKVIEADEAYHGRRKTQREPQKHDKYRTTPTKKGKGGGAQKRPIVALVERGGKARATHMVTVNAKNMRDFITKNVDAASRIHTDESKLYPAIGAEFAAHETVNHAQGEYARGKGDELVTTNSAEGFFGVFKRGMVGVYQHCGEQHFQRYINEFSFRHSNRSRLGVEDTERAVVAMKGGEGRRLTWRRPDGA